jgi:uncharacterized protein YggE
MRNPIALLCAGCLLSIAASDALAQAAVESMQNPATVTVRGYGEVATPPDEVIIGMGAVAQADRANGAQDQVNQILNRAIAGITASGIHVSNIQTTGISLSPVYSGTAPAPTGGSPMTIVQEPRVVGYRASNTMRVRLDNLRVMGQVIDEAVQAGANQLQDLSFQIKDDQPYRREAIRLAAADARLKAEAIASALGVQILGVRQVEEAGVEITRPQVQYRELAAAQGAVAATPVQAGEVRIEAAVNVTYLLASRPRSGESAALSAPATQP